MVVGVCLFSLLAFVGDDGAQENCSSNLQSFAPSHLRAKGLHACVSPPKTHFQELRTSPIRPSNLLHPSLRSPRSVRETNSEEKFLEAPRKGGKKWDVEPPKKPPPPPQPRMSDSRVRNSRGEGSSLSGTGKYKEIYEIAGENHEPFNEEIVAVSSLMNKQVISKHTGTRLGFITEILVDQEAKSVVCLDIRKRWWDVLRAFESVDTTITPDSIEQVHDVVLVDEKLMYRDYSMDRDLGFDTLLGHTVVSGSAGFEGRVRDFMFDRRTGNIKRIRFDYTGNAALPDKLVTVRSVEVQDVIGIEKKKVFIKDPAYAIVERVGSLDGPIRALASVLDDPEGTLDYETRYRLWEQQWGQQYREFYGQEPLRPHYLPSPSDAGEADGFPRDRNVSPRSERSYAADSNRYYYTREEGMEMQPRRQDDGVRSSYDGAETLKGRGLREASELYQSDVEERSPMPPPPPNGPAPQTPGAPHQPPEASSSWEQAVETESKPTRPESDSASSPAEVLHQHYGTPRSSGLRQSFSLGASARKRRVNTCGPGSPERDGARNAEESSEKL